MTQTLTEAIVFGVVVTVIVAGAYNVVRNIRRRKW